MEHGNEDDFHEELLLADENDEDEDEIEEETETVHNHKRKANSDLNQTKKVPKLPSQYERLQEENIRERQRRMKELGI